MGLLDEAIREHLELKRRRGADPTEVERLEREALGPVRRMAEEAPGEDAAAALPAEAQYATEPAPQPEVFDEEPGFEDEGFAGDEMYEEDTASHGVVAPPGAGPVDEPRAAPAAPGAGHEEPALPEYEDEDGPETAEYDVEAEHPASERRPRERPPAAPESDDMLEETPEFLQDAPEHDRLWFEQRPPRDFDFDG